MGATEENQNVFASAAGEEMALEHLGYKQDMIGFSFSIVTCWTALSGVFIIGVKAGGPPVMVFGWIGVCVVTLTVALSMAEMCSRWPVAGGQLWFMLTGILAMGAVNNSVASNFILGQANLVFPSFTIERWQTVLVTYAVAFSALLVNIFAPHLLNRLSRMILIWNICSFIVITITLLATNRHKLSASFVFQDFQNFTGFGQAMATIIGILQSLFVQMAFNSIYFGTPPPDSVSSSPLTVLNAEYPRTNSHSFKDISYALPLLARLLGYVTSHKISSTHFKGPFSLSLPLSLSLNALGLLFLLFAFVTFNFPSEAPVDDENMNYTSAAIGVIALVGVVTWVTTASKMFTGPVEVNGSDNQQRQ
ncbi:hypothetical protein AN1702.2 [Aspergillus nidulans FGSC A4]|nr:hypothetical protein AN1702.2 [Aspergillus nidulans FGSC A4]|eukprot:XP_659306.1 hypothetical protein AN1702.2 [Aspergillus nidulans FGSC A4]